ncbi:peptidase [Mesoflavibacter zeaxanthinifaciens subsp. sabulilitoris]|uniref:Peptidase n=1 Tax=Mesoflavibacter zeaxanthinifaciens subsp. sabulilitoris TaxID=1520893 RepID=A0A2T1N784_9FLAO|nr:peptidase [Mesoflavibacter zeaxanthinifaciens subsp. sabulilitoris]
MKNILLLLILVPYLSIAQTKYETDFNKFLNDYDQYFGYLKERKIDIERIRNYYQDDVKTVSNKDEFISLMEIVINEFYNGHISLNTNISSSNNIIPTGADIYAVKDGQKYFISDLRKGFPAEISGLKKGMEIVKYNNQDISDAVKKFLPKSVDIYNQEMYQYAINMLLAGKRKTKRKITVLSKGKEEEFIIDNSDFKMYEALIEYKEVDDNTGYIKINNSLGNSDLIPAFDKALDSLFNLKTIILDLTETPSGGNTMVGRAIMGRFINKELPYQVHVFNEKPYSTVRKWIELASPREKIYKGNLIVMVGHWTGSMGEGIAIGFDAMKRGDVVGTKMAGLIGAIYILKMSNTGIGYSIPVEKMYHVNGTPREDFIPSFNTKNRDETYKKALEMSKN